MKYLLKENIRCLILTSGTLAPLNALTREMDFSIPIRLTNPHIIEDSQVYVKVIDSGPDGELLDSRYSNRYCRKNNA